MIGLKLLIMKNRREFIKKSSLTILATTFLPQLTFGSKKDVKITILHTNDMHSHIEPFKRGRNKGLGGMAKRATIIKKIRYKEKNLHCSGCFSKIFEDLEIKAPSVSPPIDVNVSI